MTERIAIALDGILAELVKLNSKLNSKPKAARSRQYENLL